MRRHDENIEDPFSQDAKTNSTNGDTKNNDEIFKLIHSNDVMKEYNVNINNEQQTQQLQEEENKMNRSDEQLKIIEENSKVV